MRSKRASTTSSIGDEAWDVDHYLHENPELKRTAFAWMTDFVGWLPMPDGGDREAFLTADYNAEMIEHVERFPRIRDRAIFVGEPDDIVPDDFGPGLPPIRDWTERHYAFSGYITGFDPAPLIEGREELRRELGLPAGRAGRDRDRRRLRRRRGAAPAGHRELPEAARRVNGLRMIAVAGPRIDPASLGAPPGVEVRAFVPDLYRHLAACDLAVVQGGLTTTMELAAARRPFLYFPLRNHFEQNRHVRHRLERYGAGRYMDYDASPPEVIAAGDRRGDRPAGRLPAGRVGRGGASRRPHRAPDLRQVARRRRVARQRVARQRCGQDADGVAAHHGADVVVGQPLREERLGEQRHAGRIERGARRPRRSRTRWPTWSTPARSIARTIDRAIARTSRPPHASGQNPIPTSPPVAAIPRT